jgi:rubrerythrin
MALFTATEALEMAMEIEKNGEVFYNAVAAKVTNENTKTLFKELAAQEKKHFAFFQKLAGHVQSAPSPSGADYDQYDIYLKATLDNALFSGPDKALAAAEQAQDQKAALQVAIGFEKDTLLFFYDLREMIGEADRKMVDAVIGEEKAHLRRLAKML